MTRVQTMTIITALGAACAATACNRTPEEARLDGVEAQHEAVVEMRDNNQEAKDTMKEAQAEAAKQAAEANTAAQQAAIEANQKIAEAQQKNRAENADTQAKANETIRAANGDEAAAKAELRQWAQKKLDDLDKTVDSARVKAQKAVPKAQETFDIAMRKVDTKRDELAGEVASIETQATRKAEAFRAHLDTEVTMLKNRVEKLSNSL